MIWYIDNFERILRGEYAKRDEAQWKWPPRGNQSGGAKPVPSVCLLLWLLVDTNWADLNKSDCCSRQEFFFYTFVTTIKYNCNSRDALLQKLNTKKSIDSNCNSSLTIQTLKLHESGMQNCWLGHSATWNESKDRNEIPGITLYNLYNIRNVRYVSFLGSFRRIIYYSICTSNP